MGTTTGRTVKDIRISAQAQYSEAQRNLQAARKLAAQYRATDPERYQTIQQAARVMMAAARDTLERTDELCAALGLGRMFN